MDDKQFIAGFVTGEGCFTFYRRNGRKGLKYLPTFNICLAERDGALLEWISQELQLGKVSYSKGHANLQTSGVPNAKRIIEYFEGSLKGQKSRQFERWKQGIKILEKVGRKPLSTEEGALIESLKASKEKDFSRSDNYINL